MEGDLIPSDPTGLVLSAVVSLVTILGAAFTAYRWAQKAIEAARSEAEADTQAVRTSVAIKNEERQKDIQALERDLAAFKLQVTKEFATVDHVKDALGQVHNGIEKLINRIDSFAVEFNRALVKLSEK